MAPRFSLLFLASLVCLVQANQKLNDAVPRAMEYLEEQLRNRNVTQHEHNTVEFAYSLMSDVLSGRFNAFAVSPHSVDHAVRHLDQLNAAFVMVYTGEFPDRATDITVHESTEEKFLSKSWRRLFRLLNYFSYDKLRGFSVSVSGHHFHKFSRTMAIYDTTNDTLIINRNAIRSMMPPEHLQRLRGIYDEIFEALAQLMKDENVDVTDVLNMLNVLLASIQNNLGTETACALCFIFFGISMPLGTFWGMKEMTQEICSLVGNGQSKCKQYDLQSTLMALILLPYTSLLISSTCESEGCVPISEPTGPFAELIFDLMPPKSPNSFL